MRRCFSADPDLGAPASPAAPERAAEAAGGETEAWRGDAKLGLLHSSGQSRSPWGQGFKANCRSQGRTDKGNSFFPHVSIKNEFTAVQALFHALR